MSLVLLPFATSHRPTRYPHLRGHPLRMRLLHNQLTVPPNLQALGCLDDPFTQTVPFWSYFFALLNTRSHSADIAGIAKCWGDGSRNRKIKDDFEEDDRRIRVLHFNI
jgi:hypothetical protein